MRPNELRIGNLVKYSDGSFFKVVGIHEFGLDVEDNIETTYMEYENFEPIPLTEEILLKCGFTFLPQGDEVYQQIFTYNGFDIWMHDDGFCHDYLCGGDIKHLHQLQNLYFALTNEELNINL